MENPTARPQIDQVVEELEKAVGLQGGEVQTPGSKNILTVREGVNDSLGGGKLDDARVANDNEVTIASDISMSSNVEKNEGKATKMIAPYWSRVWSVKKATEDWITKDGVNGIGITATAIGLMVGSIAVASILTRDR
ncbi:hypothetical protein HanPI659440_Chr12g0443021 [Helianthus annuus]|uniref:Uncharacterized protein n=1 Tax=Helianthus annuus TaxID=4232 RepID=A0A251SYL8_HELAN|nr:putative mitochondria fission 1 protein [Helianthus annuus]KAJ0503726.1 hypothetical protein HanHA89_Chr12g0451611 [Helianthus annuus]KAJ0723998.1 hypothetical protein HanPI659440_Chr12g0443021 [Helianthus annuus]